MEFCRDLRVARIGPAVLLGFGVRGRQPAPERARDGDHLQQRHADLQFGVQHHGAADVADGAFLRALHDGDQPRVMQHEPQHDSAAEQCQALPAAGAPGTGPQCDGARDDRQTLPIHAAIVAPAFGAPATGCASCRAGLPSCGATGTCRVAVKTSAPWSCFLHREGAEAGRDSRYRSAQLYAARPRPEGCGFKRCSNWMNKSQEMAAKHVRARCAQEFKLEALGKRLAQSPSCPASPRAPRCWSRR